MFSSNDRVSAESARNNFYNVDNGDVIMIGIISLVGALVVGGQLKFSTATTSTSMPSLYFGSGQSEESNHASTVNNSFLLFALQKIFQAAPQRLMTDTVYATFLGAVMNTLSLEDSLNLYDSGHRFEHIQLLLVLLHSLPYASRVPGPNSDASSDKIKGDKDGEPSEVLWIRFLGYMKVDEMSLRKEFSPFGEIDNITTFPARTYAFVQFHSVVAACRAKEALQGKLFSNPREYICFSKSEFGPVEHGTNSINGTLPFSHKVAINSGIGSKVVENLRHERNHDITHGGLGIPSPNFNSNLERMHSGSNINLLGCANSMKTIGGGYDDIRATRIGSDLEATKVVSELSVNIPSMERSPFWHTNTPDKSRGGGSYFEDIWDSSTEDMTSREVKWPRFGIRAGNYFYY